MTAPFDDDDTAVDQPDPTHPMGLLGVMDIITHGTPERAAAARADAVHLAKAQQADAIDELRHRAAIREVAEREAKARADQQIAIAYLLLFGAVAVPTIVVLVVYGVWTGSLFG